MQSIPSFSNACRSDNVTELKEELFVSVEGNICLLTGKGEVKTFKKVVHFFSFMDTFSKFRHEIQLLNWLIV